MEFFHGFFVLTFVHLLAAASPGPDFIMVSQQTLCNGRHAGLLCSRGIVLGLSVHLCYSTLGLAAVIAQSTTALAWLKMLGGSYLLFLGFKGLQAKSATAKIPQRLVAPSSSLRTVGSGFLCNVLNPKAPIYFVSLFTIVLSPKMPLYQLVSYSLWIMLLQFGWFAFVASLLASPPISRRFQRCSSWVDRILGGAMLMLGLRLLITQNK